jgi:nucleoid DNA-binding protein
MTNEKTSQSSLGKIELIKKISESLQENTAHRQNSLNLEQIGSVIDTFLEETEKILMEGKKLTLKNYFTLEVMETKPRVGVNPSNKEKINIPKKRKVRFKTLLSLKNKLNS